MRALSAAGGWRLAAGYCCWLLAAGCWLLVIMLPEAMLADPSGTAEASRNKTGRLNIRQPVMKQ
jgi:lipoprotein